MPASNIHDSPVVWNLAISLGDSKAGLQEGLGQLKQLAELVKTRDESAIEALLNLALVPDVASDAAATLVEVYADPAIDEDLRAAIRQQCLRLCEIGRGNAQRLGSLQDRKSEPAAKSDLWTLTQHLLTAVLYLAGQRAMDGGRATDPTKEQVGHLDQAIAGRRRDASVEEERDLVDPGRCVTHLELIEAGPKLQEVTWFTPTNPVVPGAFRDLEGRLTGLAVGAKPLAVLLNVGAGPGRHWITLLAHKPVAGATDFLLFDSDGSSGSKAQRSGTAQLINWLAAQTGAGQVHHVSASMQEASPNSCGAHGLRALRMLDDLLQGYQYEPPLLSQLNKELRQAVTDWDALDREAQRAVMVRERLRLLEPLYPGPGAAQVQAS